MQGLGQILQRHPADLSRGDILSHFRNIFAALFFRHL